jgi:hypothetical protein
MSEQLESIIAKMSDKISVLDDERIINAATVAQALDALRKELDRVEEYLNNRDFQKAADLGYRGISSEYVFLQRALGALNTSENKTDEMIGTLAEKANLSYEEVLPHVKKRMDSCHPKDTA